MKKNKVLLISAIALVLGAIILASLSLNGSLFQGKMSNLNTCSKNSKICLGIKNLNKETPKTLKKQAYPDPSWYPNPEWSPTK